MSAFLHHLSLSVPPFLLVGLGYALVALWHWPKALSEALTRFVFVIALPAMMFRLMSDLSKLPPVDTRLLIAFFGACLIVFVLARLIAWRWFGLDGVSQSVFALGGVFSNTVLLGIPLAKATLGDAAMPSVALVLVFNALVLWTLVTVSVEWARHDSLTATGFAKMAVKVLTNPVIAAILLGTLWGLTGLKLPAVVDVPLGMVALAAAPMSLIALGAGLAEYGLRDGWRLSGAICAIKTGLQPLVVWSLCKILGLPLLETQVVVLLAALPVGVNVYLMSRQFNALEGPVATSMVLSTAVSAITAPLILSFL